jgi:hypothetical protein
LENNCFTVIVPSLVSLELCPDLFELDPPGAVIFTRSPFPLVFDARSRSRLVLQIVGRIGAAKTYRYDMIPLHVRARRKMGIYDICRPPRRMSVDA